MSSPPQREHDEGDEIVRVVEAVGRADGDLDPVVGRLEPGVGSPRRSGGDVSGRLSSASNLMSFVPHRTV